MIRKKSFDEHMYRLLRENNLYRKKIPDGPDSLFKAFSDALYFTSAYSKEIQEFAVKHLTNLIATNRLPYHLLAFKGDTQLWKDYCNDPNRPDFNKHTVELISSLFKVKVLIYFITNDHYLSATVVNNNYDKQIELFRNSLGSYDVLYSGKFIAKAGLCQNVVFNIVDQALTGKLMPIRNLNGERYINFTHNNWLSEKKNLREEEGDRKNYHRRSLSSGNDQNLGEQEAVYER